MALFTNVSPAMAFGILAFWFNRRDHADMLRREQEHSAQMASIIERQLTDSERRTEVLTRLERQIHDLKNAIQILSNNLDPRLRYREGHESERP